MAIPTSGQIGLSDINRELGRSYNAQISLDAAENGDYARINTQSSLRPDGRNPAAVSEWRGYNHAAGPAVFGYVAIGFNASNQDTACSNAFFGRHTRITGNEPEFISATLIYRNIDGTLFALPGWYAEEFSAQVRYWNGNTFTVNRFCRI